MNRLHITLISFLVLAFAKAHTAQAQQDFKAKATYLSLTKIKMKNDSAMSKKAESDPMVKALMEQLKKGSQQEFELEFTRTESSYDKVQELKTPGGPSSGISFSLTTSGGVGSTIYKNIEDNTYIKQGNIMGKDFVIKDELPEYEWKLLNETKKIGKYNCFKAIYVPEIKQDEQEVTQEEATEAAESGLLNMMDDYDPTISAWYTPEIPISNGPGDFHGLPGLIIEVQENDTTILLTELVLNPDQDLKLKKPKAGKEMSQEDFNKLQKKKMDEMMERQGNGKGGFIIQSFSTGG